MDSFSALNAFMYAAEMRSFTEAGRQLNLSSSAVGKAISRLEERHGVRLFHRSTRTMTLTQEGQLFLESCKAIFSEIRRLEQEFASAKAAPKGKLRVKFPLIGMLMMPVLNRFMQAYPDIELDIDFTDHSVDVIDGGYDVTLHTGEASDSRLISRSIGTYRLVVVGSPAYLSQSGTPVSPEDLASHRCFLRKCPTTGKLERWPVFNSPGVEAPASARGVASAFEPLVALAELGAGLVCVPDFAVQRQIANGALISVLEQHITRIETIRAVWPSNRYVSPKLRVFIDFLSKHLLRGSIDEMAVQRRLIANGVGNRKFKAPRLLEPLRAVS